MLAEARERVQRQVRHAQRRKAERTSRSFRDDIQGLRALAVVLVILDHLTSAPRGGFIGVDVFFVISGYLITGLLLKAGERHGANVGRFFGSFYARRARRILPAALLVLAVVWVAASIAYKGTRVATNHSDVGWAAAFLANYHFAAVGTDYFAANSAPSLVQHFWSLAVEEQFYLAWPVVIFLIVGVAGRRVSRELRLTVLLILVTAATVASFAWAVHSTSTSPTIAYFATPSRAWELGVGATLAVLIARAPRLRNGFGRASGPLAFAGLAGIIASAFLITASSNFPAPAAALPVLATALVIAASASASPWAWPLTNPVSRYLGDISYSLYLWHWPAVLLLQVAMPHDHWLRYVVTIATIFGVAALSYALFEEPIHHARKPRLFDVYYPGARYVAALAGACLVVALIGVCYRTVPKPPAFLTENVGATGTTAAPAAATPNYVARPSARVAANLEAALQSTSWPSFNPPLAKLNIGNAQASWGNCRSLNGCTFGSGNKTAVLLGDSVAMAWVPALKAALGAHGWTVHGYMLELCPASLVPVHISATDSTSPPFCDQAHREWVARALAAHPSLVILASADATLTRLGDKSPNAYQAGEVKLIRALKPSASRTVVTLSPPPSGAPLATCDVAGSAPSDCVSQPSPTWDEFAKDQRTAAAETGTAYVDTHRLFCVDTTYRNCPPFSGHTPIRFDGNHLTPEYGRQIAPDLWLALRRIAHVQ